METALQDKMPESHFRSLGDLEYTYWWHQHRLRVSLSLLRHERLKHPAILDMGCGTGGFLHQIKESLQASRAVGIDASPTAVDKTRAKGLDVIQSDLAAIPVKLNKKYDLVTAMDVLEHLECETVLIEAASHALKQGGLFLASVPAHPWLYSSWDHHLGHYRRYTEKTLIERFDLTQWNAVRVTHAFSFAYIPALIRRMTGKTYSSNDCVFPPVPRVVNRVLMWLSRCESKWIERANMPFGLSLFVLLRKR